MLDRIHKIALARVMSDLIEADFIVDESEMECFESIISSEYYSISEAMLVEAKKMDWARAVTLLAELDVSSRREIIQLLSDLSVSDGEISPLEAVQICAVEQVLEYGAEVYSIPADGVNIDNMKVLYVENDTAQWVDSIIEKNYAIIRNDLAQIGFDFVYIPFVVNDFKRLEPEYLKTVVRYMLPSATAHKVAYICSELQSITTEKFCRHLLHNKLGLPTIEVASLLIKIGESDILGKYDMNDAERIRYANFLRIELSNNVFDTVNRIVSQYRSMVSQPVAYVVRDEGHKFMYKGFHRSLFDMIAYGYEQRDCKLVFDFSLPQVNVYFEAVDGSGKRIPLKLNPQEATLYYMIVKYSNLEGGLDWRDEPPAEKKKQILEEYNQIYYRIGKGKTVNEYKDRTQIHHIKARLMALREVANIDLFVPLHVRDENKSYYIVKANSGRIQVIE